MSFLICSVLLYDVKCHILTRISVAVFLLSLSVYGILGASVSVNGTDVKGENTTRMENSTKSLNASDTIKIRAADDKIKVINCLLCVITGLALSISVK